MKLRRNALLTNNKQFEWWERKRQKGEKERVRRHSLTHSSEIRSDLEKYFHTQSTMPLHHALFRHFSAHTHFVNLAFFQITLNLSLFKRLLSLSIHIVKLIIQSNCPCAHFSANSNKRGKGDSLRVSRIFRNLSIFESIALTHSLHQSLRFRAKKVHWHQLWDIEIKIDRSKAKMLGSNPTESIFHKNEFQLFAKKRYSTVIHTGTTTFFNRVPISCHLMPVTLFIASLHFIHNSPNSLPAGSEESK